MKIAFGFELQVIAACVIGSVSIVGGIGSVFGCILGALFLGIVKNALPIIDISPFWQMGISGAIIAGAVVITMMVLGGVNIMGGSGTIPGVFIAVVLMGLVTFGVGLLNVPGIVMSIFVGALLILAIATPTALRRFTQHRRA